MAANFFSWFGSFQSLGLHHSHSLLPIYSQHCWKVWLPYTCKLILSLSALAYASPAWSHLLFLTLVKLTSTLSGRLLLFLWTSLGFHEAPSMVFTTFCWNYHFCIRLLHGPKSPLLQSPLLVHCLIFVEHSIDVCCMREFTEPPATSEYPFIHTTVVQVFLEGWVVNKF